MCFVGLVIPYSTLFQAIHQHSFSLPLLFNEIIATAMSRFAWLDVLISAIVLLAFIVKEGKAQNIRHLWMPILGTLSVGVSFGLPLFLYLRETQLSKK